MQSLTKVELHFHSPHVSQKKLTDFIQAFFRTLWPTFVWFIITAFLQAIIPLTHLVHIYNNLLYRIFTVITLVTNFPLQILFFYGRGVYICRKTRWIFLRRIWKLSSLSFVGCSIIWPLFDFHKLEETILQSCCYGVSLRWFQWRIEIAYWCYRLPILSCPWSLHL
jgi:hypothetical protein